jgi:hypothetical protein
MTFIGFLHWFKARDKFVGVLTLVITLLALYSLYFHNNNPVLVLRFYAILLSLLFVYYIPFKSLKSLDIVIYLHVLQGLVIVSISAYLSFTWESSDYLPIRFWFIENGFGDVYTHGNGFFRVQIKGNALIPFFALVSNHLFDLTKKNKYKKIEIFLLIATIFAGNFMYLIGCLFYYLSKFFIETNFFTKIKGIKHISFFFLLLLSIPILVNYSIGVLEMKSESGSKSSIGIRFDQANVLLNDISDNTLTVLTGKGLGNVLNIVTESRDYTGDIYFEVQLFYFLNQLGFLFFILYVFSLFYLYNKFMRYSYLGVIYLSYIAYAISNPYIFDTNHLVVIVTLCLINRCFNSHNSHSAKNSLKTATLY